MSGTKKVHFAVSHLKVRHYMSGSGWQGAPAKTFTEKDTDKSACHPRNCGAGGDYEITTDPDKVTCTLCLGAMNSRGIRSIVESDKSEVGKLHSAVTEALNNGVSGYVLKQLGDKTVFVKEEDANKALQFEQQFDVYEVNIDIKASRYGFTEV